MTKVSATTAEEFDRLAADAREEAANANLPNIRERALIAATRFQKLAEGERAMERRRASGRWKIDAERQRELVRKSREPKSDADQP